MARFAICIVAPFVLVWTFVSELWRQVKRAPWYAWNACMQEVDSIRAAWRANSFDQEKWK